MQYKSFLPLSKQNSPRWDAGSYGITSRAILIAYVQFKIGCLAYMSKLVICENIILQWYTFHDFYDLRLLKVGQVFLFLDAKK